MEGGVWDGENGGGSINRAMGEGGCWVINLTMYSLQNHVVVVSGFGVKEGRVGSNEESYFQKV